MSLGHSQESRQTPYNHFIADSSSCRRSSKTILYRASLKPSSQLQRWGHWDAFTYAWYPDPQLLFLAEPTYYQANKIPERRMLMRRLLNRWRTQLIIRAGIWGKKQLCFLRTPTLPLERSLFHLCPFYPVTQNEVFLGMWTEGESSSMSHMPRNSPGFISTIHNSQRMFEVMNGVH